MAEPLTLSVLQEPLGICRFPAQSVVPGWALSSPFFAITGTSDELSIVCSAVLIPPDVQQAGAWRALKVEGPLDFSLTGILAGLANVLTSANISLFALSTFDTDYILVREPHLEAACQALRVAGYLFSK